MTNNEIVLNYYDFITDRAYKLHMNEDCLQECFLQILLADNDRLNWLVENGQFEKWVVGLMKIMWRCKDSKYHRKDMKEILLEPDMVSYYELD